MDMTSLRGTKAVGLAASTSTGAVTLPLVDFVNGMLVITNTTAAAAFVVVSDTAAPTAAFPTSTPLAGVAVPANSAVAVAVDASKQLYAAAILASGSGNVYFTIGQRF